MLVFDFGRKIVNMSRLPAKWVDPMPIPSCAQSGESGGSNDGAWSHLLYENGRLGMG